MLIAVLIILIALWVLGYGVTYINFPIFSFTLFVFNGRAITLWDLFLFLVILWAIGILPRPFREIVTVIFLLWVLAVLGVIAYTGLASLLIIALIVGVFSALVGI